VHTTPQRVLGLREHQGKTLLSHATLCYVSCVLIIMQSLVYSVVTIVSALGVFEGEMWKES
jgi:hypothetical protein